MLPQVIISIIAVVVVVVIAAYGFTTRGYFVHLALISAPVFVYLVSHPAQWMALTLGLSKSGLIFPGLPQGLHVAHVLMAGLIVLLLARAGMEKGLRVRRGFADLFLILFLATLVATAYVRGFGIRALGDEMWGGMSYVRLLITGGFLLTAKSLALTGKQLRRTLYMMLGFSTLPALAQIVFTASRGSIYQQYMFIEAYVGGLLSSLEAFEAGGTVRLHMFGNISGTLIMLAGILFDRNRFTSRIAFLAMLAVSLALAGLSGFRGQILYILAMAFLLTIFDINRIHWNRVVLFIVTGVIGLIPLYLIAPHMPGSMQRAFSWLPYIDIPWHICAEAAYSTVARLQVWEMAWREVPQYLWIGKGFTVNPIDILSPTVQSNWVLNSFLSHNYHSGPLSLLLDTGLFGFLFGSLFLVAAGIEMLKRFPEVSGNPLLQRAYAFFLIHHIYNTFAFFAIFGDVRESFPQFFLHLTVMYAILNSARPVESPEIAKYRQNVITIT